MGYRRIPTIYTLDDVPEEEGLIVRIKSIKVGKLRRLMRLTSDDSADEEGIDELFTLLQESLVSWNLEEEDGTPVPATLEGIEDQETELVMRILETWLDRMTGAPEGDLGKGSASGATFPGQPLTMEAL